MFTDDERVVRDIGEDSTLPADPDGAAPVTADDQASALPRPRGAIEDSVPTTSEDTADALGPTPQLDGVIDEIDRRRVRQALFGGSSSSFELGRFVITGTLGRGGMGVVFKAFDPALDRRVALKVLHKELDGSHTTRLRREAQAMARLSHPNVVQVYEVSTVEGRTFVAMELVEGQTLRDWMRQQPRPGWRQCVEVFVQVGAGLFAAHEQGLVHRDFKPGNAIIDAKNRARVLDFGLARKEDTPVDEPRSLDRARTDQHQPVPLDVSLTNTGAVLGTPAYMPPEQMKGDEADARSDQFSFCVALYEALYGERPFEGGSMAALMVSMMSGHIRPAPKGSRVPARLRTVVLRGLAVEPADRWPTMEALLTELRRLLAPRGRRGLVVGLTLGLAALGTALAIPQLLAMQERCSGAEAQLHGIWDDTRRPQVHDAILGTELSYAEGTWARVEPRLDEYADAWVAKHTEVCEATAVRHEQTEDAMSLRMGCLRARRTSLRAAVDVLADADATAVENAVKLVAGLPDLARCDDVERLEAQRQRVPPPDDPQVAQRVESLREQLAEIEAMENAGQYGPALDRVDSVVPQAVALGYEPLQAEAEAMQGSLLDENGRYADAERVLTQAHARAVRLGYDAVSLYATRTLATVVGYRLSRHAEGMVWGKMAVSLAEHTGEDTEVAASLNSLGSVFTVRGKYDKANVHYQQALQNMERALGGDHPQVAINLNNLGALLIDQGEYEEAKVHLQRALQILEKALGPDHPAVASSLNNLGNSVKNLGEYEEAKVHYQHALRIWEKALGGDHPDVAGSLRNLGTVFTAQGNYEEAEIHHQRALRIMENALDPDHPEVAGSLTHLGNALSSLGKYEEAKAHHQRALQILEDALGPNHPVVAMSLNNLGGVFYRQGEYEVAKVHYQRALQIWETALGPDHPDLAMSLNNLGGVLSAQEEYEEAELHLQRALQIKETALGLDHPDVASSLGNLGEVFMSQGKYEEAKAHHQRALEISEQALGADHPDVGYPLVGLAEVALAQRDFTVARQLAERAVSIREAAEEAPALLAKARFVLARALWSDKAERGRARTLAEQAREALVTAEGTNDDLAEIEGWLAEHRVN